MNEKKSAPAFDGYEHYDDFRKANEIVFVLDDSIEYVSTGKYSAENYLKRLEAKRKKEQNIQTHDDRG